MICLVEKFQQSVLYNYIHFVECLCTHHGGIFHGLQLKFLVTLNP